MSGFLGSYLHQIDDKGRLSLPAPFRRGEADSPMVLLQVHGDSLSLYPRSAWQEVESKLREYLHRHPGGRHDVLRVTANAVEVTPDKQGRVPIPPRMREAVGLDGSALVVGVLDRIEVWNPERFESSVVGASPEFDRFTHQIFG